MDPKLASTIIWSLAIFQSFESPLYDEVMRSLKDWDPSSFDAECLRRLFQVCCDSCLVHVHLDDACQGYEGGRCIWSMLARPVLAAHS